MRCLARDCAGDRIARKFVAPALELMILDKAARGEFDKGEAFDREEALLRFGEMYATALAGDGSVERGLVVLAVGGELGGGAALLRLAALHLLNGLLPEDLKFGVRTYAVMGSYHIAATGEDAARPMRLLAVSAPSAGGEYLSDKFDGFVGEARVEVRPGGIRRTKGGRVAADLTISEGDIKVKYNVYLQDKVELRFRSKDHGRVELAARLLKLAGVSAEVRREGGEGKWYVEATTNKLAAGRKELRDALAEIVRKAAESGWVDAGRAERWLEKLERGRTLREGWPKYLVRLARSGALEVRYASTNPEGIEREAQRFRDMGLVEGRHFSVRMPEGGRDGYVSILKEGLAYAAWLSIRGSEEQRRLAAEFVEYILQRAGEEGNAVHEKAKEIVKRGRAVGSLRLTDVKGREVDVGGKRHVVSVIGGGAQFDEGRGGKTLLRIKITAEVDGVGRDYTMTFGRYRADNETIGFATAKASAPGGKEADAERFAALIKALTGKEPRVRRMKDGTMLLECSREHLDGFALYAELADAVMKWLEKTRR
jgi:hypothetical protein